MKTHKLTFEKARSISIVDTLKKCGHFPKKESEKESWFNSPFRRENQPSFKVNNVRNLFHDFGTGESGNIIDLVMKLNSCTAGEALQYLSNGIFSFHTPPAFISEEKQYTILKVKKLENMALLKYLESRKIDLEIAKKYCSEIYYEMKGKKYFAIAFANDFGGYEIRNKYFKGSFDTKGIRTIKNGSNSVSLFEGFIDFISYLTLKNMPKRDEDFMILNSVALIEKALPALKNYDNIFCYFDYDSAGENTMKTVKENYPKAINCSFSFAPQKDLNDHLVFTQSESVTE